MIGSRVGAAKGGEDFASPGMGAKGRDMREMLEFAHLW